MILTLHIENIANLPDGGPLSYALTGQRGADIGRDPHLDWTLPDPSRHVSGTHCEIRYQDGGYMLRDVSANGTYLNGSEHRIQSPYRLKSGDRLTIGDYIVLVEVEGDGSAPDPVSHAGPMPAFQDLWTIDAAVPPMDPREFRPPSDARPVQPDFLEWAVDVPNAPGVGFVARPANATPAAGQADMWTPQASAAPAVPKPRRSIWVSPEPSGPWAGGSEPASAGPEQPAAAPKPPFVQGEQSSPAPSPVSPPAPIGEVAHAGRPDQPIEPGATEESARLVATPGALPSSNGALPPPRPAIPARPDGRLAPAQPEAAPRTDLIERFARGAGLPLRAIEAEDGGAVMERLGRVLLQVTTSVKQLLDARSNSKRLAGSSSHTMIAALDNNPLKFSPTPTDALRIMLGEPSASYLDAESAFRQSFDDLKSHQVKVLSAMQMALERLVEDLDPSKIEDSLGEKKGPASWVGLHRAQLWTVYEQRWKSKKSRHGGGLRELFMEYFSECYDQISPGSPQ